MAKSVASLKKAERMMDRKGGKRTPAEMRMEKAITKRTGKMEKGPR